MNAIEHYENAEYRLDGVAPPPKDDKKSLWFTALVIRHYGGQVSRTARSKRSHTVAPGKWRGGPIPSSLFQQLLRGGALWGGAHIPFEAERRPHIDFDCGHHMYSDC